MKDQVSRKKFRGWVYADRHSDFIGNLIGVRQTAYIITRPSERKKKIIERIVYTGCVHGGSDSFYDRLELLTLNPADYLIFAGDISGSLEIEKLKKHFYDKKEEDIHSEYKKFKYFGEWAATLPRQKRVELLSTLKPHAKKLLKIVKKIEKLGTKIYLLEGNWDNPKTSGIRFLAGKDISEVFDVPGFLKKHGYRIISRLTLLPTKTILHILLPYITLLRFDEIKKKQIEEINRKIAKEKAKGKAIVMVGHAEANWRVHHLFQKNSRAGGEKSKVIQNFGRAMALFCPDEVIYPHQHARVRDEKGNLINLNAKYLLQVTQKGVRLIDDLKLSNTNNREILVTYVPLGYMAEEDFISM